MIQLTLLAAGALATLPAPSTSDLESPPPHASRVWGDFDGDARRDLLTVDAAGSVRLLLGTGRGRFDDQTAWLGLAGVTQVRHAAAADYDGDGRDDLLLLFTDGTGSLLRATPGGPFAAQGPASGLPFLSTRLGADGGRPNAEPVQFAEWVDYDSDGVVDMLTTTSSGRQLYRNTRREHPAGLFVDVPLDPPASSNAGPGAGLQGTLTKAGLFPTRSQNASALEDAALPDEWIRASSVPALGRLFPIAEEWFVDAATGRVGVGTVTPGASLDVNGVVRSRSGGFEFPDGTLQLAADPVGPAGPTGPAGAEGEAGATGPVGATGPMGAAGPQGPAGPAGPVGPTGPVGPLVAGPTGPAGPVGQEGQESGWSGGDTLLYTPLSARIGIGTSAPTEPFQVNLNGNSGFGISPSFDGNHLTLKSDPSGDTNDLAIVHEDDTGARTTVLTIRGNGVDSGNVGIGTETPGAKLDVVGTVRALSGLVFPDGTTQTSVFAGPTGATGPAGAQGPAGPTGPQGPEGPEGPEGPAGDVGAMGPQGFPGPMGSTGPQGTTGPDGPGGLGTQYYVLGRGDFRATDTNDRVVTKDNEGAGGTYQTGGNGSLVGRLVLPEGAQLNEMISRSFDLISPTSLVVQLRRVVDGTPNILASQASVGSGGLGGVVNLLNHVVDYSGGNVHYEVRVFPIDGTWHSSGLLAIKAIMIEYELE